MKYWLISLLLFTHLASAAEPLGRLFTSPAERDNLNRLRQSMQGQLKEQLAIEPAFETESIPVITTPQPISIQGFVQRSDGGKGTVWVNQQPVQENTDNGQVHIGRFNKGSNSVPLTMQDNGQHIRLKAGQVFNPDTGEITESNVHATEPALNSPSQGVIR